MKPKTEIEDKNYYRDIHFLYEVINTLKDVEEIKIFLKDILTNSELRMLKRRWHIANFIYDGVGPREISAKAKVSTQTVSKIKTILEGERGGLKLAIERMKKQMKKEREKYLNSKRPAHSSNFIKDKLKWLKKF